MYFASIADRISNGDLVAALSFIASRTTPRQISQVGAMESSTGLPSAFTFWTYQSRLLLCPAVLISC
jgi:hypothetical protein